MKPQGRNSDAAIRARNANLYAAKVVLKKSKEAARRRGKMLSTLLISNHCRCGPGHRQQHRPNRGRRTLPTDCMALLQNRSNAGRSGKIARIMFYGKSSWTDFPSEAEKGLKRAFAEGMLSAVVGIDGQSYFIDFLRMLQIDVTAGTARSIAWIDVDGKCFFPRQFFGEEDVEGGGSQPLKVEIEVDVKGAWKGDKQSEAQSKNAPPKGDEQSEAQSKNAPPKETCGGNGDGSGRIIRSIPDLNQSEEGGSGNAAEMMEITVPLPRQDGNATSSAKDKEVVADSGREQSQGRNGNSANIDKVGDDRNVIVLDSDNDNIDVYDTANRALGIANAAPNPVENGGSNELPQEKRRRLMSMPKIGAAVGALVAIPSPGTAGPDLTGCARLVPLEEAHRAYGAVKNLFLAGMKKIDETTRVVSVHWCAHSGPVATARVHDFQKCTMEMRATRGHANVRFAWHASSPKIVDGVVVRGLGKVEARTGSEAYGIGVYLTAEGYPQLSASHSKPAADGKFTVVLCRVILGNMEQLIRGCLQNQPCSEYFDSGVDNLRDPKIYIIWRNRMNTHIIPEYAVTFEVSEHLQDLWKRRRLMENSYAAMPSFMGALTEIPVQEVPAVAIPQLPMQAAEQRGQRSPVSHGLPNMTLQALFTAIRGNISEATFERLAKLYEDYKAGKIQKSLLVRAMRAIVGDKLLLASILNFNNKGSPANGKG